MTRGVINLIMGGIMIIGGLSGGLVLRGTESGGALALFGLLLLGLGIYRISNAPKRS
jgi:hypothetical protein